MHLNLELKARCRDLGKARRIARSLRARKLKLLRQSDTYFDVRRGRLKIREISGTSAELIYYERPDKTGDRFSQYTIVKIEQARPLKIMLRNALGSKITVRKRRSVYLYKNARIHLDTVQGLGSFIEFEVIVEKGRQQARTLMKELRRKFDIVPEMIIRGSYSDLLLRKEMKNRR